jgi:hypothetical protein
VEDRGVVEPGLLFFGQVLVGLEGFQGNLLQGLPPIVIVPTWLPATDRVETLPKSKSWWRMTPDSCSSARR